MRRSLLIVTALLLGAGAWLSADERLSMTISDYRRLKFESVNPAAYERALVRVKKTRTGMRTDEFFEAMEMLMVRDKKGEPIDGFVEGYLQDESNVESERQRPASILIFGWYEDWKKRKKPVKKFYVVFHDKVCERVTFYDPAEDWRAAGGGGGK